MATKKVTVGEVAGVMEMVAPVRLAEGWDNVGLLTGDGRWPVKRVMLAMDLTRGVHDEVVARKAEVLIVYHPPIFKAMKTLRVGGGEPMDLAVSLLANKVAVYSPHTALDTAEGGTNDVLAAVIGAKVTGSLTRAAGKGQYLKLVTFVPEGQVEEVAEAVFAAGAGHIGVKAKYTRCSFRHAGTGTFMGDESANPAVGTARVYERVAEIRFETILPTERAAAVIDALRGAHPYEEPAFDLLMMQSPPEAVGLGRLAMLEGEMTLAELAGRCKRALRVKYAQVVGNPKRRVRKVALIAGAAGRLALDGVEEAYDALVTGELKHHEMLAYQAAGIGVVCLGHSETERPVLGVVASRLRKHLRGVEVRICNKDCSPFTVF